MTLKNFVSNGAEGIPASVSAVISKKHIEKGLGDVAPSDIQWRIFNGKSRYPEHLPFLSRAAAIFRVSFLLSVFDTWSKFVSVLKCGCNLLKPTELLYLFRNR